MDELRKLVIEKLVTETDPKEQLRILQEINKTILTKYVIQIEDWIIRPLWVEAYYYNQKSFPDHNTHKSPKQKNRFGQLYFHEKGYGGLDVCLSEQLPDQEDYYLSVLLKATSVYKKGESSSENEFKKQTGIYDILEKTDLTEDVLEKRTDILVREERKYKAVVNVARVNLTKPCFKDALLAACLLDDVAFLDHHGFTFPAGYKKQWQCSIRALSEISDEEKARKKAEEYNNAKIEDKYWNLAKESFACNISL